MLRSKNKKINIVIVGAGKAGQLLTDNIHADKGSPFKVVGFIDDDPKKQGKQMCHVSVLGSVNDLKSTIRKHKIEEVFIAIPSERGKAVRRIIEKSVGTKVAFKILPRLPEVLMQDFDKDYIHYIRSVRAEDLLGGEILKSDQDEITEFSKKETVMITGAAGSIGSELSRQVAAHEAEQIVLYDWWENGMFELRNELVEKYPQKNIEFIIGNVNDAIKVDRIMSKYKPSTVFHAAAYKHVPLMEHNPVEAIKNNIKGTKTVAEAAVKNRVTKFILVSTDKAVNPTNVMGATKRAAEQVIHILAESQDVTSFCAVRFGNVINSNGSAIPIFEKQIQNGGPVTVTHKDITRYFMTIPEAVHLILQTWVMGLNNDLFVLDMGEPIKIYDLAELLIALAGYIPHQEIKIEITGLRPGEKLYEEVLVKEEETLSTPVNKVFKTKNYMDFNKIKFIHNLNQLLDSLDERGDDLSYLKTKLAEIIPTYKAKPTPKGKSKASILSHN